MYSVSQEKFVLKFQAISEKLAKTHGDFFDSHCRYVQLKVISSNASTLYSFLLCCSMDHAVW